MTRRAPWYQLVAAALGGALALTACTTAGAGGDGPVTADTEATITYAIWDETQKAGIQANIDAFNEIYPGITVNVTVTPWEEYWTKLQTQASSNTLPDIFWLNTTYFAPYAEAGKLASAEPLIADGSIDLSGYPDALVEPYAYDGVQYGIPKDFDTFAVWYNPELFAQAGVAEPTADWTWEDFAATAAALRAGLKGEGGYGVVAELYAFNALYHTIWQAGGEVLSADGTEVLIDSPATVEAIEFWQDLVNSGSMPTPQQMSDTSPIDWFGSGKAAMYPSGSYDRAIIAEYLGDAVQVAPLPIGAQQATITGGLAPVVSAGSKNLGAAQAFQAFLATFEAQKAQGDLGSIIPAHDGTQQGWVETMPGTNLQLFIDAVAYGIPEPVNETAVEWSPALDEIFVKAVAGQISAEDAAAQMAEAMRAAMQG